MKRARIRACFVLGSVAKTHPSALMETGLNPSNEPFLVSAACSRFRGVGVAGGFGLPTATERLVERDEIGRDRRGAVGQRQLCLLQRAFCIEHVEEICDATLITLLRKV